jgi:hypothetical protein
VSPHIRAPTNPSSSSSDGGRASIELLQWMMTTMWHAITCVKAKPSTRRERFAALNQWLFSVRVSLPDLATEPVEKMERMLIAL